MAWYTMDPDSCIRVTYTMWPPTRDAEEAGYDEAAPIHGGYTNKRGVKDADVG